MKNKNLNKQSLKTRIINNMQLRAIKGGEDSSNNFDSVDEQFVQDAGWVRLRELSI